MTRRTRENHSRTSRYLAVPALLCLLFVLGCMRPGATPVAVDGRLDLTHWDFERGGNVALLGTWQICWGQLLEPGDECRSAWQPVPVRGLWSEESVNSPFGSKGVATYRLEIVLPRIEERLSILAGGPMTAYKLWINGIERGGVGVVGHSAEQAEMGVRNRTYALPASASGIGLQVQVANFEFRSGGLRRVWYLGPEESIQQGIGRAILREGMVFAVGVVVGLAYLVLFALGPSERARGYFGLACLVIGLRAVPASLSGFSELVAPWAGFELLTRLEYLGTALTIFAGAGYVRTKVPGVAPPRTLKGIQLVALALAAIVMFSPFSLVLETLPLQYAMPVLVMALVIVCYGRAWLRSVPGVTITAAASLLYLLVIVHDILRTMESGIGARVELYPYAMVLWILVEAYELMRRFYQTFIKVESLSDELSEANFELQETESAIVRFVPFDFLRLLGKQSIREVDAGDRVRARISVLHCGFHSSPGASERTGAESRFELVSDLVGLVEPIIQHRGGFVNEFRGDGFQAFFPSGAPDATAAGVEIAATLRRANEDRISAGRSSIEVGIGIDTGPVLLGTVGRRDHLLRGVVGEAVDGARRIEVLTMRCAGNVLISAATREGLREASDFQVRRVPDGDLQLAEGSIEVYSVCAAGKSDDD